jgi:hypothetical protein
MCSGQLGPNFAYLKLDKRAPVVSGTGLDLCVFAPPSCPLAEESLDIGTSVEPRARAASFISTI